MISGNVSPNLGPVKCENCASTIALNHRALSCVSCTNQYHMKCGSVTPVEYKRLQQSLEQVWTCQLCHLRQLMEELPFHDVNNFDCIYTSEMIGDSEESQQDTSSLSDPDLNQLQAARQRNGGDLLLCDMNINSIQNKFEEIKDIIINLKSKLWLSVRQRLMGLIQTPSF